MPLVEEFRLPPLVLHPFSRPTDASRLLECSRASLMLQDLIPRDGRTEDELRLALLEGRYCEMRMLFYNVVEADPHACAAVMQAARLPALRGKLSVEQRDLMAEPVMAEGLDNYKAAIIDPPRAGAAAQARELAVSRIPTIVAVSCDPGTFARDARILVDGGYALEQVVPIDQFLWSGHVELVALLRRNRL